MQSKSLFILAALLSSPLAHAAFVGGNDFIATPLSGNIQVQCRFGAQMQTVNYTCQDQILYPADHEIFLGPTNASADTIDIIATHEDGTTEEKSGAYNGKTGKSQDPFNLWISTLLQNPLLNFGKNMIHYQLKKGQTALFKDSFLIEVKKGTARQCPFRFFTSSNMSDCVSGDALCGQYFQAANYCE